MVLYLDNCKVVFHVRVKDKLRSKTTQLLVDGVDLWFGEQSSELLRLPVVLLRLCRLEPELLGHRRRLELEDTLPVGERHFRRLGHRGRHERELCRLLLFGHLQSVLAGEGDCRRGGEVWHRGGDQGGHLLGQLLLGEGGGEADGSLGGGDLDHLVVEQLVHGAEVLFGRDDHWRRHHGCREAVVFQSSVG